MECLDITRSCVHPCPQMDVMSAVIMGSLWQAYWDSLQKRAFSFTDTTRGDCSFFTVACNLELQVLTQAVRAMSPHGHIAKQLQSQGIKASLTPASPWTESPKQESHNTEWAPHKQSRSEFTRWLWGKGLPSKWWLTQILPATARILIVCHGWRNKKNKAYIHCAVSME